jgi:transcriptional regulator with XRE-family HTH domain
MTQVQVAEAAGILRTSVANFEAGRQKAPLHVLYALCQGLGVEVRDILPTRDELSAQQPILQTVPPKAAAVLEMLLGEDRNKSEE